MNDEEKRKLMKSFLDDSETQRMAKEARNAKWRAERDAKLAEQSKLVEGGTTIVDAPSLSAAEEERRIRSEGQKFLGRNPEEVVIERRTDWDLKK